MTAKVLHLKAKNRTPENTIANLEDFDYEEGELIDPLIIINQSNITLYCLDFNQEQAIFVETPPHLDLSQFPFFYLAQYDNAQRLIAVPWNDLFQLVEAREQFKQLIVIYSVGRCGSTLLSQMFNQVDTVLSLSEPDVFSQLVGLRNLERSNDREILKLLKACLFFIGKQSLHNKSSCLVIKLRSFAIELGDLIKQAFPNTQSIFLYRNAKEMVKSSIRAFGLLNELLPKIEENINFYSRFIPLLKDYKNNLQLSPNKAVDFYTIMWLSVMERYIYLNQQRKINIAIRYEDLVAKPEKIITWLFQELGLPITQVSEAYQLLNHDSQEGSNLSKQKTHYNQVENLNSLEICNQVNNLLKQHPIITKSDFIVPDTLGYTHQT